jgi:hypothetical protein
MEQITMTKTRLSKNTSPKNTFKLLDEITTEVIPRERYEFITKTETLKWFRSLGGSETAERSYTCRGYNVTKLTSTSPDKQIKVIREFKFI